MADTLIFQPIYLCLADFELQPYVRMTRKSLHVDKYALRYLDNQTQFRQRVQAQLAPLNLPRFGSFFLPDKIPFQLVLFINTMADNHHCDLDNLVKSVLDASAGLLFKDDRYCDQVFARRYFKTYDQNLVLMAISDMTIDTLDLIDSLFAYPLHSSSEPKPKLLPTKPKFPTHIGENHD